MTTATRTYTIAEFMALPQSDKSAELVRGEIQEVPMAGDEHNAIEVTVLLALGMFVQQHKLGRTYTGDASFVIDQAENTVRMPDVAFVSKERWTGRIPGAVPVPPDLAVEIISPNDSYGDVDDKVADYQRAGVRLIWVINPRRKTVRVYRKDSADSQMLTVADTLSGEDVVPGFALAVRDVFEPEA